MFQEIPVSERNIFAFKASGKLTDKDYQAFLPRLSTLIDENGPLSLLIELEDFHGWELKAAWDDFKFGKAHEDDFKRIAIVGENRLEKWMAALGRAFTSAEVRYFGRDRQQAAWDWLREADKNGDSGDDTVITPYAHIVAAVDFTPHAEQAVARALELARHYQARLSLLHVVEYITYPYYDYDTLMAEPYDFVDEEQRIHDLAESRLAELAAKLDYPDLQHQVLWGEPKATVISYAEAQQADLIVVGTHGRHGIARLMGSTATAIVHRARCDVTVIRLPGK